MTSIVGAESLSNAIFEVLFIIFPYVKDVINNTCITINSNEVILSQRDFDLKYNDSGVMLQILRNCNRIDKFIAFCETALYNSKTIHIVI